MSPCKIFSSCPFHLYLEKPFSLEIKEKERSVTLLIVIDWVDLVGHIWVFMVFGLYVCTPLGHDTDHFHTSLEVTLTDNGIIILFLSHLVTKIWN